MKIIGACVTFISSLIVSSGIAYFFWFFLTPLIINFAGGESISPFAKLAVIVLIAWLGGIWMPLVIIFGGVSLSIAILAMD